PYVSRAAHKLIGALDDLDVPVSGRALDAGASTGGFTQVLLERGCRHVYCVDVGHGQLHPRVASDPRVTSWERLHLRDLSIEHTHGELVDLVVADVSFISLTMISEPILALAAPGAHALLMVKPQFEVGRERLGAGGVVTDPAHREFAVGQVLDHVESLGWWCRARAASRLAGPAGNLEEFVHLVRR
ncbi:MAG: TlyA family RNA methyltransferase, partial [Propionibacteriales bacterium]|nr:TlyA family RNA methyltransferase [Propionibacteriales bacterium]